MEIVSQLYGGGGVGEIEGNIAPIPKEMVWLLTHLTGRRSVAVTVHAQCLFFNAGEACLTCARKVVTRIADRRS